MNKFIINEKGLTLIELITSITILSVVMISFFTFFTNAFRFNSVNSDDIQSMNIAREQKAIVENYREEIEESLAKNSQYILISTNQDYDITITVEQNPLSENTFNNLHKVHVEVIKNKKLLSETYSYFESEKGE